jgi:capsular exopolysaccharide synthesis family protein
MSADLQRDSGNGHVLRSLDHAQPDTGSPKPIETSSPGYGLIDPEVHLSDYLRVVYKRRWPALTCFLVVFVGICIYTFTATPIYDARVQILIEKEASNVVTFKEAIEQNQVADDYYQTQYRILQSRALARRTMDALNLWTNPQFGAAERSGGFLHVLTGWMSASRATEPSAADETKAQSRAIDRFLTSLTISPVRNSRLVDVRFESADPVLAANVANALARAYIAQNLEYKFLSSKEASDWLAARLAEQRKQVESSEQALQQYREQTEAVSLEDRQNIVVQKLADLNAAVTHAKTERIQKEAAFNQIQALQNDRAALDSYSLVLSNPFIQQQKGELADLQRQQAQLSERLGPNHPDMVKLGVAIRSAESKIQGEIAKIVQAMRNDYEQAVTQERSLTAMLEQQKRGALELNRKGIQYGVLARDAASNRQIFESLMQRAKETGIAGDLKTSNIRIVDAAEVPRTPSSPSTRNNLLVALFGGSILAVGLAFFFEYIDSRLKNPVEVSRHLQLPFLGMVPALFEAAASDPLINNGVPAHFSESMRTLRTNVLFSSAEEGARSLTITSTGPGEGKTLVASNLAIGLAQAGMRVLLIDADMRKPRVHTVFNASQKPGLSNMLVGTAKFSESVLATNVPGLWIVPAGTNPPNPSELLGSKRFGDLIASLGRQFDWAIIDTPPVMAVTDSAIVAHLTTGVLFVVGADMTTRQAAQRAVEQLDRSKAKFVGVVLNRVDLKHNSYYYAPYYRSQYGDYYQSAAPQL